MTSNTSPAVSRVGNLSDANFPMDPEGRTYHVQLKKGEIANNIVLVGDDDRATIIRNCFDAPDKCFSRSSSRHFTTYTGTKNGVPVSVMSIGMGAPMMDFAIREIRAITEGPLNIIRLGSCGTPQEKITIGSVVVADRSIAILTNPDAYRDPSIKTRCFIFTLPCTANAQLHKLLVQCLNIENGFPVVEAPDATADTFYGSQGRIDPQFDDRNKEVIGELLQKQPTTGSLQMETFYLYHLADVNRQAAANNNQEMIRVAGCAIALANRFSNAFLDNDSKHKIEKLAGNACLVALTRMPK